MYPLAAAIAAFAAIVIVVVAVVISTGAPTSSMYRLADRIGHRGLAALAPENTLAGIRLAKERGFEWVEVDARLSADGIAVLSHDESLQRRGGVDALVAEMTAKELVRVAVAEGFADFADATVPKLADALRLAHSLGLGVVLEIKPSPDDEERVLQAVAAAMQQPLPPVIFSSFSRRMLLQAQQVLPEIPRALNCGEITAETYIRAEQTGAINLHCHRGNTPEAIAEAVQRGYGVYCFTVNDLAEARALRQAGAHGVFTDVDWAVD